MSLLQNTMQDTTRISLTESIKTMNSSDVRKPTFGIYRADGSKLPTLKKSFIIKMNLSWIDIANKKVILEDGTIWILSIEPSIASALKENEVVYCVVSFQVHITSFIQTNLAVARLYK